MEWLVIVVFFEKSDFLKKSDFLDITDFLDTKRRKTNARATHYCYY